MVSTVQDCSSDQYASAQPCGYTPPSPLPSTATSWTMTLDYSNNQIFFKQTDGDTWTGSEGVFYGSVDLSDPANVYHFITYQGNYIHFYIFSPNSYIYQNVYDESIVRFGSNEAAIEANYTNGALYGRPLTYNDAVKYTYGFSLVSGTICIGVALSSQISDFDTSNDDKSRGTTLCLNYWGTLLTHSSLAVKSVFHVMKIARRVQDHPILNVQLANLDSIDNLQAKLAYPPVHQPTLQMIQHVRAPRSCATLFAVLVLVLLRLSALLARQSTTSNHHQILIRAPIHAQRPITTLTPLLTNAKVIDIIVIAK